MALYHAIGSALVSQDEINFKAAGIRRFAEDPKQPVEFSNGELSRASSGPKLRDAAGNEIPFQPIGLGKPLLVQLRHVYRGAQPLGRRPERKKMLVTSAMKSVAQFNAQPRAINFLTGEISQQTGFSYVAATDQGTPIIYYSPALTVGSSVLTIDVGFDDFSPAFLNEVGDFLQQTGAIPAFLAQAAYLVGAGLVVKLAAAVAERFLERGPVFTGSSAVDFVTPGSEMSQAGFKVLTPDDFPNDVLRRHDMGSSGQLLDDTGKPYSGEIPYVTFSLDGTQRDEFNSFEATQASAALLADYFAIRDGQRTNLDLVLQGLQLFNDLKFRRRADSVKQRMDRINDPNDPELKKLQAEYEALIKNIKEEKLRPSNAV